MKKNYKWKYRINIKKKILVLVILGVFLFVGLGYAILESNLGIGGTLSVSKYDKTLYGALKSEVDKGYALRYTNSHQDSMDSTKSTEDIYYFFGSTIAKGADILDKNNVVFAGYCWRMIRTTDTGGVRLLYNGNPEITESNGEIQYNCGDTRNLYGIGGIIGEQNLGGTYKYAKNYTATTNGTTTTFTLVDDPNDPEDYKSITIDSGNAQQNIEDIIANYPYTCRNSSDTCTNSSFYKVDSYTSGTKANMYASTYRDSIGLEHYNDDTYSPAYVGYKYGDINTVSIDYIGTTSESYVTSEDLYDRTISLSTSYYYSDSVDWNSLNANNYTLVNATQVTSNTDYSTLAGKYVMINTTIDPSVYYIIGVYNTNKAYIKSLSGGDLNVSISIADSLNSSGQLDSPTTITLNNWYNNYSNYLNKYTCGYSSLTCSTPRYITQTKSTEYTYLDANEITIAKARSGLNLDDYVTLRKDYWYSNFSSYSDYKYTCGDSSIICTAQNLRYITKKTSTGYEYAPNHYFGTSVKYENNKYVLQNTLGLETASNMSNLSTHHYTCMNLGESECTNALYVYYYSGSGKMNYVTLNNQIEDISDILDNMLTKNTTDSKVKNLIESWYVNKIKDTAYESKVDDTIYCNNRSISQLGGWNPNGGMTNQLLQFAEYSPTTNLSCPNITDKFSVANNDAKLLYPIGLITTSEMNLLGQNSARTAAYNYWFMSPNYFSEQSARMLVGGTGGSINDNYVVSSTRSIRPAISLVKGTCYSRGNGHSTNPYVVDMN